MLLYTDVMRWGLTHASFTSCFPLWLQWDFVKHFDQAGTHTGTLKHFEYRELSVQYNVAAEGSPASDSRCIGPE